MSRADRVKEMGLVLDAVWQKLHKKRLPRNCDPGLTDRTLHNVEAEIDGLYQYLNKKS